MTERIIGQIRYIYSIAYRLCGNQTEAEDITQETIMTALEKQSDLKQSSALRGWMRRICVNLFYQQYRRKNLITFESSDAMNMEYPDNQLPPEDEVIVQESLREIQNACFSFMATSLSLYQRTVFVLVDIFGVSLDETAEILLLSNGACKSHLHRARKNLGSFFSQYCQHLNPGMQCRCSCEAWKRLLSNRDLTKNDLQKMLIHPDYDDPEFMKKGSPEAMRKVLYLFHKIPLLQPDELWYQTIIRKMSHYLKK